MTFTRTVSGLSNYPAFFRSELVVYVEGKSEGENTFDQIYYENLIKKVTKKQFIKIKPVGNKQDALSYFENISALEDDNSIVIIDKDLIGISSSHLEHKKLFITYGYSWENDFWSLDLCKDVIGNITIGNSLAKVELEKSYRNTLRWASKISALDIGCQVDGFSLFQKNGSSCGINLSHKSCNLISTQEFKRHINKYRSKQTSKCSVINEIINSAMKQEPCKVVNGHLWEHIVIAIISCHYKKATKSRTAPTEMIKNIAFSKFIEDPLKYITCDCLSHFQYQFSRIGLSI